jgi:hypothetical protein
MNNFDKIKPLSNEIDSLLLDIKGLKPNLFKEYTLIVDDAINGFIDLGANYIEDNPQEFEIFLKKLNDVIKILEFIKSKENIKETKLTHLINKIIQEQKRDRCLRIADRKYDKPSAYKSGAVVRCRKGDIWKDLKEDESLHKWFKCQGTPGKQGGWIDCNAPIRKDGKITGYKPCGRKEGEKRSKYPACRPTAARCKDPGKGKTWGKTK